MSPISILPHEEVILRKLAEYMEINVVFTNGYTVYEAVNGVNIAFSYIMHLDESGKCPFQKEFSVVYMVFTNHIFVGVSIYTETC